jgi:hypothetical protein
MRCRVPGQDSCLSFDLSVSNPDVLDVFLLGEFFSCSCP